MYFRLFFLFLSLLPTPLLGQMVFSANPSQNPASAGSAQRSISLRNTSNRVGFSGYNLAKTFQGGGTFGFSKEGRGGVELYSDYEEYETYDGDEVSGETASSYAGANLAFLCGRAVCGLGYERGEDLWWDQTEVSLVSDQSASNQVVQDQNAEYNLLKFGLVYPFSDRGAVAASLEQEFGTYSYDGGMDSQTPYGDHLIERSTQRLRLGFGAKLLKNMTFEFGLVEQPKTTEISNLNQEVVYYGYSGYNFAARAHYGLVWVYAYIGSRNQKTDEDSLNVRNTRLDAGVGEETGLYLGVSWEFQIGQLAEDRPDEPGYRVALEMAIIFP